MNEEKNYSIFYYTLGGIIGTAIITTGIIIGNKLYQRNLEEITKETSKLAQEITQHGIGS